MNKPEDYLAGLTDNEKEIFIVFDVINNRGTPREAQEEIARRLRIQPPHRTTITPIFRIGHELFRKDATVLTNEEINGIIEKVGYGIPSSKVVELHRLYLLWKIHRHEKEEKLNLDAILPTLGEIQNKVWFLCLKHWDKEKIAEKLGISRTDAEYYIEKTKERLEEPRTKEETKMEQSQSMVNLPPWVNQAQWEHLEGKEQRDEREGIGIVTYPGGIVIRQQLEFFKGCFPDIYPNSYSLYHPLDDENVMAQLRGHLPDEAFWSRVKDFWEKAKKCDALRDAACEKFTSGEKLALLEPSRSLTPDAYITSGWAHRVLVRALSPELEGKECGKYYHLKLKDDDFTLEDDGLIYRGPDYVAAEQRHRQLVEDFRQTEEFNLIASLMKELRDLRPQILVRIDQCLRKREYSYNYCPDCPADQARKMLTSRGE